MTGLSTKPLARRVAVVTGSLGKGIGRSTALRLAEAGANLVLNYGTSDLKRDRSDEIARVEAKLGELGVRCVAVEADTRTMAGVDTLVNAALSAFGSIDILINNAGAPWLEQDFAEIDPVRWRDTIAAEITGPARLIGLVLPHMRNQRWGRIINIAVDFRTLECILDSSYGNRLAAFPFPFAIGKSARIDMTEMLAHAEIRNGITINSILPGIIEDCDWDEAVDALGADDADPPLLAGPDDVAKVIAALCTGPFSLVTGSRIVLPGNLFERIR